MARADAYGAVTVTGGDARRFLHGILSANVEALRPGDVGRSLLLEPRGKLVAHGWLVAEGEDRFHYVVDRDAVGDVLEHLDTFRFRVDAALGTLDPVVTLWSADAPPGPVPEGATVAVLPPIHAGGPDRVVVLGAEPEWPVPEMDPTRFAAMRILAGEPVVGVDVDRSTIPQEALLVEGAVDFDKGCYLGQELVARIDARGHVNRLLRIVEAAGPLEPGTPVAHSDRQVGTLSSTAPLGTGGWVALGLLRAEVGPGTAVDVDGTPGTVTAVPAA